MIIDTAEIAKRLERSIASVTKAARAGRFGTTAHRDERGRWLFDYPAAAAQFKARTDTTRYDPRLYAVAARVAVAPVAAAAAQQQAPRAAPGPTVVVYEGPNGRYEITHAQWLELQHADANPDLPLLTPALIAVLDRILWVRGDLGVHPDQQPVIDFGALL